MSTPTQARRAVALPALPIDPYRGIAAVLLLAMLGIAVLAPLAPQAAAAGRVPFVPFDGRPARTLADALFNYPAAAQRMPVDPPARNTLLREPPFSTRALRALAGEMEIEDTNPDNSPSNPPPAKTVRDDILLGGPERWDNLESFYKLNGNAWAASGLAIVAALRATVAEGADREVEQRLALSYMNLAAQLGPPNGPYLYNWALLQIALGDYQQAATRLDQLVTHGGDRPEVRYHEGLALLRLGEPAAALAVWQPVAAGPASDWQAAAAEGLADARAAGGDTAGAAAAYEALLDKAGAVDWGLYDKLLRLQLARGGAARALDTVHTLAGRYPDGARLHYDEGRLRLLLGQTGAAVAAFRAAVAGSPDDPALQAGLAQALLAQGDLRGAQVASDAAIRATGGDPATGDLGLTYSKLTNPDPYQRSIGQAVLDATLVRAGVLAAGHTDQAAALAAAVDRQGAGGDATKAAWFHYYAGLIDAAAGLSADAVARFRPASAAGAPLPGPTLGARLLAWAGSLTPAQGAAQAAAIVAAAGGQDGRPTLPTDAATATAYEDLAGDLETAGRAADAAPFYRAAAAWEAGQAANDLAPPAAAAGTDRPVAFRLAEADYLRRQGTAGPLAPARYAQALAVAPALAGAHTNRALLFDAAGQHAPAAAELARALQVDPANAVAAYDQGVLALRGGPLDLGTALAALSTARVHGGPALLASGNSLLAADSLGLPAAAPAAGLGPRIAAAGALLLLLLYTLIPARRPGSAPDAPARGLFDRLGDGLAAWLPAGLPAAPALVAAVVVGGLAWGWALSGNEPMIALALLPLSLLAALVAVGAQEGAHRLAVRREAQPGLVRIAVWPLGLLLAIVGAPFGVHYGWLVRTQAGAQPGAPAEAGRDGAGGDAEAAPVAVGAAARPVAGRERATTVASRRAAATRPSGSAPAVVPAGEVVAWRGWGALGPAARVALAGLLANAGLAVICAVLYGLLGSPLWRILLLGNVAVLAFTGVSAAGADGAPLWRRSPLLWLLLFSAAAGALTILLLAAW